MSMTAQTSGDIGLIDRQPSVVGMPTTESLMVMFLAPLRSALREPANKTI